MTNDYSVTKGPGDQLYVLLHRGCKVARAEILALLQEAGFDPSQIIFLDAAEDVDCDALGGVPLIIPVDDESGDLPELDHAGRCSGRVVVLLGPGCSFEGLHPLARKYGTQCGWSADRVKRCVSNDAETPQNAAGAAVHWDKPKPVICRKSK
jgi:hypothetical protein